MHNTTSAVCKAREGRKDENGEKEQQEWIDTGDAKHGRKDCVPSSSNDINTIKTKR